MNNGAHTYTQAGSLLHGKVLKNGVVAGTRRYSATRFECRRNADQRKEEAREKWRAHVECHRDVVDAVRTSQVCMYVCVCVYMYVCMYVCTYLHICTLKWYKSATYGTEAYQIAG
jgi:hypothetical protein